MFRKSNNTMLDSVDAAVKSNLIERMKECVKELQLKYTSEQWVPLKNEEATSMLCWILEAIFIHGLKNTFIKSLSVFASRRENSIPNPSFWDFVMIFSHRDIIEQIRKLNYVNTDIGRCRAWIRIALNEMSLVSYLENMFRNPSYVRSFYKPSAFLRDTERCDFLKNYLVGIVESCKFELVIDNSLMNQWNSGPLALVGLWVDENITQGIDIAQNMDSKDMQAIPQLGKSRTPEPQFINVLRRQPLLPEEDAFRIIMSSKPTGSGTSSRRNSDSSQQYINAIIAAEISHPITTSSQFITASRNSEAIQAKSLKKSSPSQVPFIANKDFNVEASLVDITDSNALVDSTLSLNNVPTTNIQDFQTTQKSELRELNEVKLSSQRIEEVTEELSYSDLLKTYNQDQIIGAAIFSGSPQQDLELASHSTAEDTDCLEETTSSSELPIGSENEDGSEIIAWFAEKRPISEMFINIAKYSGRIASEIGMDTQNYSCKSCRSQIGMIYFPVRFCHFTGFNYCTSCHTDEVNFIPSKILLNWNFNRYPVCKQAYELLEEVKEFPIFDVHEINPKLYSHVNELAEIKKLRTKLNYVSVYLKTCKDPKIFNDFKNLASELSTTLDHLFEHVHRYSIFDLSNVTNGTLTTSLSRLLQFGKYHILHCKICKAKGFICEICRNAEVIFPFNLESIFKCHRCGAVYHKGCMNNTKPCPRCDRWKVYASDEEVESDADNELAANFD